ncbi:SRPBCC family protein [Kitasatospora mediocidica]|uniref:SRPBCC family protein n=1 Tax=Kitasatospora mediocidica TaxID=58352 RepID=UPI0005606C77|nr:SRPBCC family protein [Kitasatospora mediocidica]
MSRLEEQIDVDVPIQVAWEQLHRVQDYPRFVDGVLHAHTHGGSRAHLDIEVEGTERAFETEITDRGQNQVMTWQTMDSAHLKGTFALLPLDAGSTRVQIRVEYEPDAVREAFGGPHGFAQVSAIERTVRADLEQFKQLVEEERPMPGG